MAMTQQSVSAPRSTGRRNANAIVRATEDLAKVLQRIESGELPMSPTTVRELEDATRVLEDLVAKLD